VRDVYLTEDPREAALLLDRAIAGCLADDVDEIVSLGNSLKHWRTEILAHHLTGASNGPTEAMNLLVKKIKRCGHGFKSFRNYADPRIMPIARPEPARTGASRWRCRHNHRDSRKARSGSGAR